MKTAARIETCISHLSTTMNKNSIRSKKQRLAIHSWLWIIETSVLGEFEFLLEIWEIGENKFGNKFLFFENPFFFRCWEYLINWWRMIKRGQEEWRKIQKIKCWGGNV